MKKLLTIFSNRTSNFFLLSLFILVITGVLFSSCGTTSSDTNSVAGTYSLVSLQVDGGDTVQVNQIDNAQLTINADGTWRGVISDSGIVISGEGEYTVNGEKIIFFLEGDVSNIDGEDDVVGITGEIMGNRISIIVRKDYVGIAHRAVVEKE